MSSADILVFTENWSNYSGLSKWVVI